MRGSSWGYGCALIAIVGLTHVERAYAEESADDAADPFGSDQGQAQQEREFGGGYGSGGAGAYGEGFGGGGYGGEFGGYGGREFGAAPQASPPQRVRIRSQSAERINAALDQPLTRPLEYVETPLNQITAMLQDEYDIPIVFDTQALDSLAISPEIEITANLQGITLRSALELMLREVEDLTYIVDSEVLLITSEERADSHLETRVFPVADLVDMQGDQLWHDPRRATPQQLIDAIHEGVAPDSWAENGTGEGRLQAVAPGMLVVRNTSPVLDEVDMLLAELRNVRTTIAETAAADSKPRIVTASIRFDPRGAIESEGDREALRQSLITASDWHVEGDDAGDVFLHVVGNRVLLRHAPATIRQVQQAIRDLNLQSEAFVGNRGMGMSGGGMF